MNKKLFRFFSLVGLLSISVSAIAQTQSPYSQLGIGDIKNAGFGQNQAMGGVGIASRSNEHLNNVNPASYSALDSLSVIYELGLTGEFNSVKSNLDNTFKTNANFSYLSLGFRLSKYWFASFGVAPLSTVDYAFKATDYNSYNGNIDSYFFGSGGLNKVYLGNSIKLIDNLSIGFHATYVFGAINKVNTKVFRDDLIAWNTKFDSKFNIYDIKFDYGVQYTQPLKNDYSITLGAVYENKSRLNTKVDILAGSISNNTNIDKSYYSDLYYAELIDTLIQEDDVKGEMVYPSSFGFGFMLNKKETFRAGADFKMQNWSELDVETINDTLQNLFSVNGGFEYIPDKDNINNYFKRVRYRFGGHFTQTQLYLKNEQINDYGISFGVGLPLRNSKTSFNLSFELGQRGTLDKNLLRETYGIISLNLSLSDIWFVKRKFN